jgi:hypothetical protein
MKRDGDCASNQKRIAIGVAPMGTIAIGIVPMGVISIGVVPMGVVSIGVVAMGVFNAAIVGMGLIAVGFNTMGVLTAGPMSMGLIQIRSTTNPRYLAYPSRSRLKNRPQNLVARVSIAWVTVTGCLATSILSNQSMSGLTVSADGSDIQA